MARPVTLFTGQWADVPLARLAEMAGRGRGGFGYDGLELACWGDHFDVAKAARDRGYCQSRHDMLAEHGLRCWAIGNHLAGQAVCDPIDARHKAILPKRVWGDGKKKGVRERAAKEMMTTARAAARLGVGVVNGFTGSAVWHKLYFFPPTGEAEVDEGFRDFAQRWAPILDVFRKEGVRFALEVHPGEIAYDIHTARRALEAVGGHEALGFNFDPSHLHWQFVDPVKFIEAFPDRIFHVHVKDCARTLDGESGVLGSHIQFGGAGRGWDFRSPGRGQVDFEEIIRALNRVGYSGPLSVEWEDAGMEREHGAREAAGFVRRLDFAPPGRAFDEPFSEGRRGGGGGRKKDIS